MQKRGLLDLLGAVLSGLCLIHCLALPLLVSLLPAYVGLHSHDAAIHTGFAALVVPVGFIALWPGYRHHRAAWVLALGGVGLVCIGCAVVARDQLGDSLEHALTVLGGFQLLCAHLANRKLQRSCC